MRSLETIQKTFRVFQSLTKVFMILSFVWAGLTAIGLLCGMVWYHGGTVIGADRELLFTLTETGGLTEMTVVLLAETVMALADGSLLAFAYRYFKTEQAAGTPFPGCWAALRGPSSAPEWGAEKPERTGKRRKTAWHSAWRWACCWGWR